MFEDARMTVTDYILNSIDMVQSAMAKTSIRTQAALMRTALRGLSILAPQTPQILFESDFKDMKNFSNYPGVYTERFNNVMYTLTQFPKLQTPENVGAVANFIWSKAKVSHRESLANPESGWHSTCADTTDIFSQLATTILSGKSAGSLVSPHFPAQRLGEMLDIAQATSNVAYARLHTALARNEKTAPLLNQRPVALATSELLAGPLSKGDWVDRHLFPYNGIYNPDHKRGLSIEITPNSMLVQPLGKPPALAFSELAGEIRTRNAQPQNAYAIMFTDALLGNPSPSEQLDQLVSLCALAKAQPKSSSACLADFTAAANEQADLLSPRSRQLLKAMSPS